MLPTSENIQIISAPSILGLKPHGVQDLANSLLASGLEKVLGTKNPVVYLDTLNDRYSREREAETKVLNSKAIRDFSLTLGQAVGDTLEKEKFPFLLGGDCSILIGIMSSLKARGCYGLIFLDAHADFYKAGQSISGEVADMDLAIVTGRGPEILTNINQLSPYIKDEHVMHIGQRDWEETRVYGSDDIRHTLIKCYSLAVIRKEGMAAIMGDILQSVNETAVEGFWIHYDTDVLSDEINPAVDYRLHDGLQFNEVESLLRSLLLSGRMVGLGITIFNPRLDKNGSISKNITQSLGKAFDMRRG